MTSLITYNGGYMVIGDSGEVSDNRCFFTIYFHKCNMYLYICISTCYHENKSFFNDSIFNDFPLSVFITSVRGRELSATALITVRKSPQHPEIGALMAMYNRWKKEKKNKNKTYDRENSKYMF